MLVKEVDISPLMTYTEQIESEKIQRMKVRESKRARFNGDFSHAKTNGSHFQQVQGSSKGDNQGFRAPTCKVQDDVSKGGAISPKCPKCGRNHVGDCLRGTSACYGYGKMMHKVFECPNVANKGKEGRLRGQVSQKGQVQQAQGQRGRPRGNRFYAFHARQEVEESPDVVTGMLRIFDFDAYALLDPSANSSFVTLYLVIYFDMSPEALLEPYLVYTLAGESVLAKKVDKKLSYLSIT